MFHHHRYTFVCFYGIQSLAVGYELKVIIFKLKSFQEDVLDLVLLGHTPVRNTYTQMVQKYLDLTYQNHVMHTVLLP